MALPSIEQASQTINGVIVQCSHITCPEPANFRMEDVLEVVAGGYFTWQTVAKASAQRTIVVMVGNVEASFDLTTEWTKFIQVYEGVDPTTNRDVNLFFPAGEYWLYHTMLEKGNRVSDWSASPQDTEEQLAQIYVEIREQYTQIMSDTEHILLEAISNYVKISDFETFKEENTAAIDVKADEILSTVAQTYTTQETTSSMQSVISQQASQIESKVSQTDYNGTTIASLINQSADSVKIQANHITLSGDVVLKSNLTDGTTQISGNNIKTGTIDASQVTVVNIDASKITTGQIQAGQINVSSINIDSAQIATGTINQARIPELSADKITSGTLDASVVTVNKLNASNITTGTLNAARIPDLSADKITTGELNGQQVTISHLNASNIDAGTLNASRIATGTIDLDRLTAAARGTLVKSTYTETEYYLSNSASSATGGSWSATIPSWASGKYLWTREKTTVTLADNSTSTTYRPSQSGAYDKNLTTALSSAASAGSAASAAQTSATNAQNSANSATSRQQTIYYAASSGTTSKTAPSSWITDATGGTNKWTTVRPEYSSSYPVLFVATQKQTVGNALSCTTPAIDKTTTVIDGGNITTGTISAARIDAAHLHVSSANIDGTIVADSVSASNITAGTISAAVEATNFTMKGGSFQVSAGSASTNYISLKEASGNRREIYVTAGTIVLQNSADNYVLLDASGGLYLRDRGGLATAMIEPTGRGYFKNLTVDNMATLPATTATSLKVNGVTVTGASDAYATKLGKLFGSSADTSNDAVRLPAKGYAYFGSKSLTTLLNETLTSAQTYADSLVPTVSSSAITTGRPSGISEWNLKYRRYGNLCTVAFWFTATAALTSTNGNGSPGLPAPISIGSSDYKLQWYGSVSSTSASGYAYVGSGGSLNCRTNGAGTFYGCITYPVA